MSKPEHALLLIDPPSELKFEGPFNTAITCVIKLTNITDKKVHYKLKTTAPKRYCVRPNSGVLRPKGNIEVQVVLQPFVYDPEEKNKHKFMVQSVIEPEGSTVTAEELWKSVDPDKIMNSKLKCVIQLPHIPGSEQDTQVDSSDVPSDRGQKWTDKTGAKPLSGLGGEIQKVAAEVKQLRGEESKLRQENIMLKEEILRLRQESGQEVMRHSYSPPTQTFPESMSPYIIMTVLITFVVAFLLSKIMGW